MAIPKPDPKDWLRASATELRLGDRETLQLLQQSYKAVQKTLESLPDGEGAAFGKLIQRAQMERVRRELLAEQSRLFDRLGDKVSARRLRSATRAAKLSRVADRALLTLAGAGDEGKRLYDGATITAQRTIDTMLARVGISKLPLAERIYNTRVWMDGRLDALINGELAKGLNAARFAKVARDWFNPSVKGGTRYAAMRLARTEINNAFHATSITYAQDKPWISQMNWNLSESHPAPDKCNEYADLSPWDVYAVPRKPHPQCLCNVTEVQVGEDEWMDKFIAGDFDAYLDAELDKADERLGIKPEPQKPVKVGTAAPGPAAPAVSAPRTLAGDMALKSVKKGLPIKGSLTTKQRNALKQYESAEFQSINGNLRRDSLDESPRAKEFVSRIDSAMDESVLDNPLETWRGMGDSRRLFGDALDGDLTGFSWQEKSYSSTSTEEKVAKDFAVGISDDQNMLVRVLTPAGIKGLQISDSSNGNQAEILLQKNTKWSVVKDHGIDSRGVRRIDAELVPITQEESSTAASSVPVPRVEPAVSTKSANPSPPLKPDDGYRPDAWTLEVGNQTRIDEVKAELEKNGLTPEMALTMATKFIEGTTDDTDTNYRNGPHLVRFTGSLTREEQQRVLESIDILQNGFPTGQNMNITFAPSTEFGFGVGGETTLGTGAMHINEKTLRQKTWPGMPASKDVSSVLYVLAHEWGHSASPPDEARETHVHNHAIEAGGMTSYGTHGIDGVLAPAEGYAEAFAEWALTKGKTTNPAALEYAKHFKWSERWPQN